MSLETRSLVAPGELGYPPYYGSVQADCGHDDDELDGSHIDEYDFKTEKEPLYPKSSVISVSSFSELFQNEWDKRSGRHGDNSDDEESPPLFKTIYRRSCKDKTKLAILSPLYFLLMILAAVIAFYSIESLILSYQHRVRSVKYVTVEKYHTIGIAMFPQDFAKFKGCEFMYADDLAPSKGNWSRIHPAGQECNYTFVTFRSRLVDMNRTAMVFNGPTLVKQKQSLAIHFTMNTSVRQFSAMEYLLLEDWHMKINESQDAQAKYLANMEYKMPLFTVPAGFRTWVKMSYLIRNDGPGSQNLSDFVINSDFATYTGSHNTTGNITSEKDTAPIYALFEWKTDTFQYVTEIVSTTIWNTLGSLAGVFVTIVKAGEYCQKCIQRIRRDRRKKLLKLQELEEQRKKMLEEYHQNRMSERLKKKESMKESLSIKID